MPEPEYTKRWLCKCGAVQVTPHLDLPHMWMELNIRFGGTKPYTPMKDETRILCAICSVKYLDDMLGRGKELPALAIPEPKALSPGKKKRFSR